MFSRCQTFSYLRQLSSVLCFYATGVSMLKVTYTDTGLFLEYCAEPLDILLGDRVRMYVHAQRSISIQPIKANIPLPASLLSERGLESLRDLDLTWCDRDWIEITLPGIWIAEDPTQDLGVFVTELDLRLELRLLRLWQLSQQSQFAGLSDKGANQQFSF